MGSAMRFHRSLACALLLLVPAACGGGGGGGGTNFPFAFFFPVSPGPVSFTASPLATGDIVSVTPLGNLNPPAHTFPTDHIYFYWVDPDSPPPEPPTPREVYAPAGGTVLWVLDQGGDQKLLVMASATCRWYLDHVLLDPGIGFGVPLVAGQRIGTTSPQSYALDLGVVNDEVTLGFVRPERYPSDTLHADAPLKYFAEPLRTTLYAMVNRAGPDKDGKIDFDVAGRLSGNWFHESLPVQPGLDPAEGTKHLAFVVDMVDPSAIRVSIGGTLGMTGAFAVQAGAPDPASVSVASGKVAYRLYNPWFPADQLGLLIVEMLDDVTIRAEYFPGTAETAEFTEAAQQYVR